MVPVAAEHYPVRPAAASVGSARRWRDLGARTASAAALAPLTIGFIWLGGLAWAGLLLVVLGLLCWEWQRLCARAAIERTNLLLLAIVLAATGLGLLDYAAWVGPIVVLFAGGLLWAVADRPAAPWLASGAVWLGLAGFALSLLRRDPDVGRPAVLFLVTVVWASDIGAYAAGRLLGGPRLAPRISPAKTWAGAAGGLLAAILAGGVFAEVWQPGGFEPALVVAALLGLATQAGDLLESAVKRRFGVKDSSRLIPGHGGLLDRLDGLLTAAPLAAVFALAAGPGRFLWTWPGR